MSFKSCNGRLRKIGRRVVLPVDKIKAVLEKELLAGKKINLCVDFGGGSLVWAEWLKDKAENTYAVDIIYDKEKSKNGIRCVNNIDKISQEAYKDGKNMFFAVDVFHHLEKGFEEEILQKAKEKFDYVIIKDIDCHKRFGNFMNRMHDKILNGEIIRDINPDTLLNYLSENGYKCSLFQMRKLWYPHFLIIAKR